MWLTDDICCQLGHRGSLNCMIIMGSTDFKVHHGNFMARLLSFRSVEVGLRDCAPVVSIMEGVVVQFGHGKAS